MDNTIKILPIEEMRIVKRVDIIARDRYNFDTRIGFVIYERQFRPDYKFAEKEKSENEFLNLTSYPRQEDFPSDEIDELILSTIKLTHPKSQIHNELLFSSFDVDSLNNLINRPAEKANLIIRPEFYGQDLEFLVGKSFKAFLKSVNIYVDGSSELIKNLAFYGCCNFKSHEVIYARLDKIKFL